MFDSGYPPGIRKDHLVVRFFEATRQHVRTEEEATEQSATTDGPTEGSSQEEDLQRVRGSWMMLEYVGICWMYVVG